MISPYGIVHEYNEVLLSIIALVCAGLKMRPDA